MKSKLHPWNTLSRRVILEHSKFLTVESHTIELPEGEIIEDWPWVIIPDAAIVIARTVQDQYLCFRQTKYAVRGASLAPVAGMVSPGEDPLAAARRELLEETGYEASEWTRLGSFVVDPNRGAGVVNLFLADGCKLVADPDSDDLEDQVLVKLTRSEMESALRGGEFKVLSWTAGVALALLHQAQTD